jgi:hypothetical protein
MKYRGFEIEVVYGICADWDLDKNGTVISRRPKKEDICHYQILDNGREWIRESSVEMCKTTINQYLLSAGLKKNTVD